MNGSENRPERNVSAGSFTALGAHLTWLLIGPALLFVLLYSNATEDASWWSWIDIGFFLVLGWIIVARWVDQRSGQSTTADGSPSTWQDFRHFVKVVFPSALILWAVTNVLGNYFLL
ncbi:MAG: hypothetical protein JXB10_19625 [Pirellulales bacterium]|nr:hypothetical protein [Pirellulales bacterium]